MRAFLVSPLKLGFVLTLTFSADEEEYSIPYSEPPPLYSPLSPLVSPVVFAYPVMYPTVSPSLPFALPPAPVAAPISPSHASPECDYFPKMLPNGRPALTLAPVPVPPHAYSPHRVVDGSTLAAREQHLLVPYAPAPLDVPAPVAVPVANGAAMLAAGRGVVRPVSTPPTPLQAHAPGGVARVRLPVRLHFRCGC